VFETLVSDFRWLNTGLMLFIRSNRSRNAFARDDADPEALDDADPEALGKEGEALELELVKGGTFADKDLEASLILPCVIPKSNQRVSSLLLPVL